MKSCRLSIKDHCVLFRRMFYIDTLNVPSIFYNVVYCDSADFKWNLWGTLERRPQDSSEVSTEQPTELKGLCPKLTERAGTPMKFFISLI